MPKGYMGKILHVNLSRETVEIEEPAEAFYRRYLGGSAMNLYYILRDTPKNIDAFDPENVLAMSVGVLTGFPFSGQSRMSANAKSPLTGAVGDSQCGGFWPAELKFAGFDGIIIKGRAASPVYLWIHDGECEIRDASALWGMQTGPVQDAIRTKHGDKKIEVLQIGPAGESGVRFAGLINHCSRANGRNGIGAVMGSKNLKAIAVRGRFSPEAADAAALKDLVRKFAATYRKSTFTKFGQYGTGRTLGAAQAAGALATNNYSRADFPGWKFIDGITLYDQYLRGRETGSQHRQGRDTCYGCIVRCKRKVQINDSDLTVDPQYGGPEYETLAAFGSYCGIDDLRAVCKANEICNRYGMDTISCGATIAWAMEAFEAGIITEQQTNGIQLKFGSAEAMLEVVGLIAKRQGFGKVLGEGSARAAEILGKGAEFLVTCKNQELPAHMPHLKRSLALIYAVNPFGADHQSHEHDGVYGSGFAFYKNRLACLGIDRKFDESELSSEKIRTILKTQWLYSMLDSLCLCQFVWGSGWQLLGPEELVFVVRAITGWDATIQELLCVGERRLNMMRAFNMREGYDVSNDRLPEKFFSSPLKGGTADGWMMNEDVFNAARKAYYRLCGWDVESGNPAQSTLKRLGIVQ